jgi:hypothetical protein
VHGLQHANGVHIIFALEIIRNHKNNKILVYRLPLQGGIIQVLPNAPITDPWWEIMGWVIYLLAFWAIVGMFLLNMCLAIIVDTFGRTQPPTQKQNNKQQKQPTGV